MSSLIVPVTEIEKLSPHRNADALELAQVLGWQLVVKKGEYQVGDKIVYFPIDTLLPLELSERFGVTKYLSKQRIRCAKLRGEPSFGLAVRPDRADWPIGENVADYYGVHKYEPPVRLGAGDAEQSHPLFLEYTDIENMRNFPTVFEPDETTILSEKVHGCLFYKTMISMADGTRRKVMDVQKGEYVLGVDENGKIIPSLVLNTFNNGKAEKWLTVNGKRKKAGRGNNTWNVHCTPNHRFWNPQTKQYIAAENLNAGDKVLLVRREIELTPIQEQILIGKMLGDGYLHTTSYEAAGICLNQKLKDKEYMLWTLQGLGDIACQSLGKAISGYGTEMIRANTTFHPAILSLFKDWKRKNEEKHIPEWVANKLSPISMAFWYMDDGSLSHHEDQEDRANIAVCAFTEEDCKILQRGLARFDIQANYYVSENNHSRFRLNADDAEKFFLLIAPYIPPCMQYKLPERYRGHAGWLPSSENTYKSRLVEQTVDFVREYSSKETSSKWDLETETHNFFANYILVHNSNSRVGMIEGELMAGSKAVRRKRPPEEKFASNIYWYPLSLEPVRRLIETLGQGKQQLILFGEVYGSKIQSFHYGHKGILGYRAFDLLIDGKYLDWSNFCQVCADFGVETVPIVETLPFDLEIVKLLSEGKTLLMEQEPHIREGLVVRPLHERTEPKIGRVILKYVSDSYLFGEKSDFTDQ